MKNSIPQYPVNLSGSFWGLTVYYNPARYKTKLKNYKLFRKSIQKQGLKLLCVELSFGDKDFELEGGDADILIQRKSNSILWQKERLLNVGLDNLPDDCDKIVWLDADIIFCNDQWINQTEELLDRYNVVQPFSSLTRLPKEYSHINFRDLKCEKQNDQELYSIGYAIIHHNYKPDALNSERVISGGAISARRAIFNNCKLYDRMILGGGDTFIAHAIFSGKIQTGYNYSPEMLIDLENWKERLSSNVKGSIYYTPGKMLHLWHGSERYRSYSDRYEIIKRHGFKPMVDIKIGEQGCFEWATDKTEMHREVKNYFWRRNEDSKYFIKIILEANKAFKKISRLIKNK